MRKAILGIAKVIPRIALSCFLLYDTGHKTD